MWDDKPPQNHESKEECLMVDIVTARQEIGKFFYKYGFGEKLSSVPQNRLAEIISSLAMKGNQSKTTDFAELGQAYRTTYGHFLSKGKWDEEAVSQKQQEKSLQKAAELALAKHAPLYLSIDDTVIEKKNHPRRSSGPWKEQAGTILIWPVSRYSDIRYLVPISAQAIFPFATVCAAAVQEIDSKLTWQFSFWTLCRV